MAAKFKLGDTVTSPHSDGVIIYITPEEQLGEGEQTYHVECINGSSYDCDESTCSKANVKKVSQSGAGPADQEDEEEDDPSRAGS